MASGLHFSMPVSGFFARHSENDLMRVGFDFFCAFFEADAYGMGLAGLPVRGELRYAELLELFARSTS